MPVYTDHNHGGPWSLQSTTWLQERPSARTRFGILSGIQEHHIRQNLAYMLRISIMSQSRPEAEAKGHYRPQGSCATILLWSLHERSSTKVAC